MKLSLATLPGLPAAVAAPRYARADLRPGIVHIGCGNFHRAHMAVYLDDLFNLGRGHDWAIIGAGVRPEDGAMRDRLAAQDWLTTVIELGQPELNQGPRVTGAMIDFLPVTPGHAALIERMSRPDIRIVSLTVTEGGYFTDPRTGTFSPDHPDIRADAAQPGSPRTVFGAILAALRNRRAAGLAPFTVMSCDNLPHNGHVTRDAVVGLAALIQPTLAEWVREAVAFPNSMVDRITPATGPAEIAMARALGIEDAAPVTCEPFRQWVVEDDFPQGRPALEEVGVTFTPDVALFEAMKIRMLNGGHAIIAYPAGLRGIEFAHEAMADPQIAAFLQAVEQREIMPTLPAVPGQPPQDYLRLLSARFANAQVRDTIRRLCLDGSNRQPKFIVPTLRDRLAAGQPADGLILLSALWCRYCHGQAEDGTEIAPNDPNWPALAARAREARERPEAWLEMADVYGELGQHPALRAAFATALRRIWGQGSQAAIAGYLAV